MSKNVYQLAILPGDGIGEEVMAQALKTLDAVSRTAKIAFELQHIRSGGKFYLEHGSRDWEEGAEQVCSDADLILLGAVGWPDPDGSGAPVRFPDGRMAGYSPVIGNRVRLNLYANVRPVRLYPNVRQRIHGEPRQVWEAGKVDMVFVRENTEGMYVPTGGVLARGGREEVATDTRIITREASERVIRFACELARDRDRGAPEDGVRRVTSIAKDNVLKGCMFFQRVFNRVIADYPELTPDTAIVDAFTQWLIGKPEFYNVLVTTNMFGDICTDLASVLQGGMGLAAGCNIGDDHAMMEPIHGSAPKHSGKDRANPMAMLLATKEGLAWLGRKQDDPRLMRAAEAIETAVSQQLAEGKVLTYDLVGRADASGCNAVGDAIAARVEKLL
ncbi:MAG: isocitrate/isopropylmalate dehydrogenase family protein [Planctomycetes bacterium]|nr:isocitrate/isopropylmalate dehydrogenase family protein [Planctomycetota bacterium]MCB9869031.1 isocitrate/isopropylmalate dehydrogenase family protein [Planctomycetota bacterium]MCB9887991.1 isocitrate/isopropylmalate dehydrogenase family protein [Planctomycetota bacterium]